MAQTRFRDLWYARSIPESTQAHPFHERHIKLCGLILLASGSVPGVSSRRGSGRQRIPQRAPLTPQSSGEESLSEPAKEASTGSWVIADPLVRIYAHVEVTVFVGVAAGQRGGFPIKISRESRGPV